MKLIIALFFVLSLAACNNSTGKGGGSKPDTIRTLLMYESSEKDVKYGIGFRITKDTFSFVSVDSTTQKKSWIKHVSYYIPFMDSTRDKQTGRPILDSIGRPTMVTWWIDWPKSKIIIDAGKSVDSIQKVFDQRLKDSISKKMQK